jgi:hypothetical protein
MKTIALLACVVGLTACDDDSTTPTNGDMAMVVEDLSVTGPADVGVRRTADIPLMFQPAGLWWDSASNSLYIANDGGSQIIRWREDLNAFVVATNLPQIAPASGGLGQLIKAADGTWLVTRFGFGMAGAILHVDKNNETTSVPGLASNRRRIGLTQASDGSIYTGWFIVVGTSPPSMGTVSKVALDGSGETDIVNGIGKPVGVLAMGSDLYISDQMNGVVLKVPQASSPDAGTTMTFATIPGADQLAAGPNNTIFAVSNTGTVWSIDASGTPTSLHSGYKPLRGVAYDPDHQRLIVAEPDKGSPDGGAGMPMLHVFPVN